MTPIQFGRDICGDLTHAESREWLVTNGIGGYGCGTIAGILSRHYHGLLVAALHPPLDRILLLTQVNETVELDDRTYPLYTNRWANPEEPIKPLGYECLEQFHLEGTVPVWTFACADAQLQKRVWMQQGSNTTYVRYTLGRARTGIKLHLAILANHRSHHNTTIARGWRMAVATIAPHQELPGLDRVHQGLKITAFDGAVPLYVLASSDRNDPSNRENSENGKNGGNGGNGNQPIIIMPQHHWHRGYALKIERYRGISPQDDHLEVGTMELCLEPGQSFTLIATTEPHRIVTPGDAALAQHQHHEQNLYDRWRSSSGVNRDWVNQLVLAADQFVVDRSLPEQTPRLGFEPFAGYDQGRVGSPEATPEASSDNNLENSPEGTPGKTIIAGYPWFGDWGRDTMICLPGLAMATGRPEIARSILQTFGDYFDQGMLPNMFPEAGATPTYNTVDSTLWYFIALQTYHQATGDDELLQVLFPALEQVITWHQRGTRYQIHLDHDGLIYAGEPGVQLTWMDAKVGDWVVTPRIGKPVEINALWFNALQTMVQFARHLGKGDKRYVQLAHRARIGFQRFWSPRLGYCYDILDGPNGNDASLRPNQIFAVSLAANIINTNTPNSPHVDSSSSAAESLHLPLLTPAQQRSVVDTCAATLLTSHGLRSLAPDHPQYEGHYGGDPFARDGAYHQGTVWGWLIGPFVEAHFRVYGDRATALSFLEPMANHLRSGCVGTLSEIFDGDAPFAPRGAYAQAWTVAEVLRLVRLLET
jgi:glycogen debranching enzyme